MYVRCVFNHLNVSTWIHKSVHCRINEVIQSRKLYLWAREIKQIKNVMYLSIYKQYIYFKYALKYDVYLTLSFSIYHKIVNIKYIR